MNGQWTEKSGTTLTNQSTLFYDSVNFLLHSTNTYNPNYTCTYRRNVELTDVNIVIQKVSAFVYKAYLILPHHWGFLTKRRNDEQKYLRRSHLLSAFGMHFTNFSSSYRNYDRLQLVQKKVIYRKFFSRAVFCNL